jgi:galactose mutarotase-like enzyme
MPELKNGQLHIEIAEKGAELRKITRTDLQQEYLWNAGPAFWAKSSPVLFPIVGTLKENTYTFEGKNYTLSRHGFARDQVFTIASQDDTQITFELNSSEETLKVFPFQFRFAIIYTIDGARLTVTYRVENKGDSDMYFSVGAHPAFKVPLEDGVTYEDYYLAFNATENARLYLLSDKGLIEHTPVPFMEDTQRLDLKKSLFYKDALVFKNLSSNAITVKSDKKPRGLTVQYDGFPFMGIWAAIDADFVCIEPWCGIADSVDASGDLKEKEGINKLAAAEIFERSWSVETF